MTESRTWVWERETASYPELPVTLPGTGVPVDIAWHQKNLSSRGPVLRILRPAYGPNPPFDL